MGNICNLNVVKATGRPDVITIPVFVDSGKSFDLIDHDILADEVQTSDI